MPQSTVLRDEFRRVLRSKGTATKPLSCREAAQITGVSYTWLAQVARSGTFGSAETLVKMAIGFDLEANHFSKLVGLDVPKGMANAGTGGICIDVSDLDTEDVRAIREYAEFVRSKRRGGHTTI